MNDEIGSNLTRRDWTFSDVFVVLAFVVIWAPVVGYTFTMPDAAVSPWPDGPLRFPSYSVSILLCAQILLIPFWVGWYCARLGQLELNVTASFLRIAGTVILWSVLVVLGAATRLWVALPSSERVEIIDFACRYGIVESAGNDAASVATLPGFEELNCGSVRPVARIASHLVDSGNRPAEATQTAAVHETGRFDVLPGPPRYDPTVVHTTNGQAILVFSTVGQAMEWSPDVYQNARPLSAHEFSTVLLWHSSGWEREVRRASHWTMMTMGLLLLILSAMWLIKLILDAELRLRPGKE
jgi:hypothetical protein